MNIRGADCAEIVEALLALYERSFGGKQRGRFRISSKLLCRMIGQRRIWPDQIEEIRRRLYDRGFLFIDLETYYAIVSQKTFAGYRRVNEASIADVAGTMAVVSPTTSATKTVN